MSQKIIGRREYIDLPELDLFSIEAKIDTGAYGNALHCHHVRIVHRNGKEMLSFKVLDPSHPEYQDLTYYAEDFTDKMVKSSTGISENRYLIKTQIRLFGSKRKINFTLTDRKEMKYPILLGRKFLSKKYLVDVSQKYLSGKDGHG